MSDEGELAQRIGNILNAGPANAEGLIFRDWKRDAEATMANQELDRLRAVIREEIHRALYPTAGMVSGHEHRRVEMVEESGKRWRGMLYAVDEDTPAQVPATGICWACARPGGSMQMEWYGQHLIHATDECRALAKNKPEQREHRG